MNPTGEYPSPAAQPTRIGNGSFVTVGLLVTMLGVAGTFGMAYQRLGGVEAAQDSLTRRIDRADEATAVRVKDGQASHQTFELRITRLEDSALRYERTVDRIERKLDAVLEVGTVKAGGRQR